MLPGTVASPKRSTGSAAAASSNTRPTHAGAAPLKSSASASASASAGSGAAGIGASHGGSIEDRLWVDKYKPAHINEIIGSADIAKRLVQWLRQWDAMHIKKTVKVPFSKENPGAKAVLLSGPPGIGKVCDDDDDSLVLLCIVLI